MCFPQTPDPGALVDAVQAASAAWPDNPEAAAAEALERIRALPGFDAGSEEVLGRLLRRLMLERGRT